MGQRFPRIVLVLMVSLLMVVPSQAANPAGDDDSRLNDGFRTFPEVVSTLHDIARDNPDIAVLYDLGELYPNGDGSRKTSREGNTFWAIKISDNPQVNESDEPDVLYVSMHHAREWMALEAIMYLLERIVGEYGTNATITDLVETRELWFFPVLNPDGFIYSGSDDRTWRKNRRDNGDGSWGVDPNRNYGFAFAYDNSGSSPQGTEETYRGPYPFSEPCTQVMRDFAEDVGFVGSISYHTYSEVILFPYAYRAEHAPHYAIMKELGRLMAAHNGYEYGDVKDGTLYSSNGEWSDFMYHNTSCLPFTFELNSLAQGGFYVDSSLIPETVEMNYEPAIILARYADDYYRLFASGVSGRVEDPRGNPLEGASVTVELLGDDELEFVTGPDGTFSFTAPPDLFYAIKVEKEGYSKFQESVQVMWEDRLTDLLVTIKDNVPPVISRVEASHGGEGGSSFGIGQNVRIDVFEASSETGLEGHVTIQNVKAQYFLRKRALTWDEATGSYYYVWNTSGLKPHPEYLVSSLLRDIDGNEDADGVQVGRPDLTLELRDITPPVTPGNLSVSAPPEGGSLLVTWEANTDDTQLYTLERRRGSEGQWSWSQNISAEESEYLDEGLVNDVVYEYRLMAWDKVPLPSDWSAIASGVPRDTVAPGPVTGLFINAPPEGGVLELQWTESTDDTAVYLLQRDDGEGYETIVRLPRGSFSHVDRGLENGKGYYYRILAEDASANEGPLSEPVLGLPQDTTPPQPPVMDPLPALTNQQEQRVSGTAEANASVSVVVNTREAARLTVGPDGSVFGNVTLEPGVNRIKFRTIDGAMNPSAMTAEVIVNVDVTAPQVTSSRPYPDQTGVLVNSVITLYLSEKLLDSTVSARLEYAKTGVEVPSTFVYDEFTKTVEVQPADPLEKGTRYRVVLTGTDEAGNDVESGHFEFTSEEEDVDEPSVGTGTLVGILVAVVLVAVVASMMYLRGRRGGGDARAEGPAPQPRRGQMPPQEEAYDPTPEGDEAYRDDEWAEY